MYIYTFISRADSNVDRPLPCRLPATRQRRNVDFDFVTTHNFLPKHRCTLKTI